MRTAEQGKNDDDQNQEARRREQELQGGSPPAGESAMDNPSEDEVILGLIKVFGFVGLTITGIVILGCAVIVLTGLLSR